MWCTLKVWNACSKLIDCEAINRNRATSPTPTATDLLAQGRQFCRPEPTRSHGIAALRHTHIFRLHNTLPTVPSPYGMASLMDRSDMILRTAFFLLSPHTPDKSAKGGDANALEKQHHATGENGPESGENGAAPGSFNYFDHGSDSEELLKYYKMPMQFGTENYTTVTSQIGSTAHVPCRIHHIGEGVVSWIRRKDYHLLTVGLTTYSSDERFSATHLQNSEDWTLQIKFVQDRDAGLYECQVSTHPPTSIFLELKVVGKYIGAGEKAGTFWPGLKRATVGPKRTNKHDFQQARKVPASCTGD
uniref:Ig-like domain-containing protein n=2 Tax=Anopheles TaxID=7164 RepID=A0A182IW03_ANOAO